MPGTRIIFLPGMSGNRHNSASRSLSCRDTAIMAAFR